MAKEIKEKTIKKTVKKADKKVAVKVPALKKAEPKVVKTKTEKSEIAKIEKREFKVIVSNIAESPYKLRLVAGLVRRKSVERALAELEFTNKKGSLFVKKAIESGSANAKNLAGIEKKNLYVKSIMINEAAFSKRWKIASRSRVASIKKRRSHINLILFEK